MFGVSFSPSVIAQAVCASLLICPFLTAGNLRSLNELAKSARADYIIHTGDFGFYDETSLERIAEKCDNTRPNFGLRLLTNV